MSLRHVFSSFEKRNKRACLQDKLLVMILFSPPSPTGRAVSEAREQAVCAPRAHARQGASGLDDPLVVVTRKCTALRSQDGATLAPKHAGGAAFLRCLLQGRVFCGACPEERVAHVVSCRRWRPPKRNRADHIHWRHRGDDLGRNGCPESRQGLPAPVHL